MELLTGKRLLLSQPILIYLTIVFIITIGSKVYARITVGGPAAGSTPGTHCLVGFLLILLLL
jgi:hypothetical protein